MKNALSQIRSRIQSIITILREKKIFRGIGVTYLVAWNLTLVFLVGALVLFVFIGSAGAGYFASLVRDEPLRSADEMRQDIFDYEETSQVFFANNVYLGELPAEVERHYVALDDISEHLIHAIIATEDEYFYEHDGIVPKAILRATYQEFAGSSVQTGGSTLTQQLIKNQILTSDVSFDRKATEILLAMRLEHFLEKEEILEAYLNVVPFGRNASGRQVAGAQAAAKGIFGVDAKDLNLPQAAFIAGLPQSPFGYTPFTSTGEVKEDLEPGLRRMKTVLNRLYINGYITESELEEALDYDIRENLTNRKKSPIEKYPYLTYEVMKRGEEILYNLKLKELDVDLDELEEEERQSLLNNLREEAKHELRHNGYRIHTTIDKNIYEAMNNAVKDDSLFGPTIAGEQEQVGALLLENSTGAIKGFVAGRDEGSAEDQYNHATQAYRPNGSTMKPLLAYGPAMEIGAAQPGFVIPDTPATYPGTSTPINNFDRTHMGLISVRESLARSRNVPAVRAFLQVPHEQSRETMRKLGFQLNDGEPYPAAALGATDHNVTVEQNTNAFATFANGGQYVESYMIEKIETADGTVIYEHKSKSVDVFTPQTSYLMIDMMRDVLRGVGTANSLPGRLKFSADWAGKTGTSSEVKDSWFVGLNPNVTLGVWIGYDTPKTIQSPWNGLRYGPRTQQIWARIANAAYDENPELMAPNQSFEMPEGIVRRSVCSITGTAPSKACEQAGLVTSDLFNAKFLPKSGDDGLESARYVTINGKNYLALDSTPQEFTEAGLRLSSGAWNMDNIGQYLPDNLKGLIPDKKAPNNGKTPGPVSNIRLNGTTLQWDKHTAGDIVGYRIYRVNGGSTERVGSVKGNETTSYNVSNGNHSYYVTAVDSVGRESSRSSAVQGKTASVSSKSSQTSSDEKKEEKKKEEKKEEKNEEKKDDKKKQENEQNNKREDDKPDDDGGSDDGDDDSSSDDDR
ncbi:transglycosylase domain-containing protein [Halalkalibacterium halodurans]|uniref:Penicillin-binding protein n=1 Tax=Halalkalibacterium halodurans TaxID=86665 RepID=A0A0M0KHL3_ALKHA|nr:transglycosylase domain-containing protein [Halalkalibacterium halodurans]TPE69845.1 penicillin-binding protein [Halalkalibacterium halodurans]